MRSSPRRPWLRRAPPARAAFALLAVTFVLEAPAPGDRMRGVSLVAPRGRPDPGRVRRAAELGADWVAVVPYAFLRPGTGEVLFDRSGQYRGERSEGIREQVTLARRHGMRVFLKPHVWSRGRWVGDFLPDDPGVWLRWEEGYRAYLVHMAELAEELDVELLAVGTELKRIALARPEWIRSLVAEVRGVYGGELTYAANWDAYRDIAFWDALDYVGVNAYFPLTEAPRPGVGSLTRAWAGPLAEMEALARRVDRPVIVTEFGWRSVEGAAGPHWELPSEREARATAAGRRVQARGYEAFFRAAWDEPWLRGAFLWKWWVEAPSARGARRREVGYTPQGKPAEEVIGRWFGGDAPVRGGT